MKRKEYNGFMLGALGGTLTQAMSMIRSATAFAQSVQGSDKKVQETVVTGLEKTHDLLTELDKQRQTWQDDNSKLPD